MTQMKNAYEGNQIKFNRMGFTIIGIVQRVKVDSVLVSINDHDAELLKLDTPLTVVSHKHYEIID